MLHWHVCVMFLIQLVPGNKYMYARFNKMIFTCMLIHRSCEMGNANTCNTLKMDISSPG